MPKIAKMPKNDESILLRWFKIVQKNSKKSKNIAKIPKNEGKFCKDGLRLLKK